MRALRPGPRLRLHHADSGGADLFVHVSVVRNREFLEEGDRVQFLGAAERPAYRRGRDRDRAEQAAPARRPRRVCSGSSRRRPSTLPRPRWRPVLPWRRCRNVGSQGPPHVLLDPQISPARRRRPPRRAIVSLSLPALVTPGRPGKGRPTTRRIRAGLRMTAATMRVRRPRRPHGRGAPDPRRRRLLDGRKRAPGRSWRTAPTLAAQAARRRHTRRDGGTGCRAVRGAVGRRARRHRRSVPRSVESVAARYDAKTERYRSRTDEHGHGGRRTTAPARYLSTRSGARRHMRPHDPGIRPDVRIQPVTGAVSAELLSHRRPASSPRPTGHHPPPPPPRTRIEDRTCGSPR